jgi:hypothetical protein
MASYKELKGQNIVGYSSDPPSPNNGDIWYNTTEQQLKVFEAAALSSFSSAPPLNTARGQLIAGGNQTSALAFGGRTGSSATGANEDYNGSSWTTRTGMNNARYGHSGGARGNYGNATSGVSGPNTSFITDQEQWNGTSWLNIARDQGATVRDSASCGNDITSYIVVGGVDNTSSVVSTVATVNYYGTGTLSGNINTARFGASGFGSPESTGDFIPDNGAMIAGGMSSPSTHLATTETYNGAAWTTQPSMSTERAFGGSMGTLGDGVIVGGEYASGAQSSAEKWNGSTWTTVSASLPSGRMALSPNSVGSASSGMVIGGSTVAVSSGYTSDTLDYNQSGGVRSITNQ